MASWAEVEQSVTRALGLSRRPVAVAFRDTAPAGVTAFAGAEPSGCSFWRLAAAGPRLLHRARRPLQLPDRQPHPRDPAAAPRAPELEQTLGFMAGLGYVRMEEVPGIPRLPRTPGVVVYAPLGETPVDPDVVLVAGRPGRVMLLMEAAGHAGVTTQPGFLGRPTCMALPAALAGGTIASTGASATASTPTSATTSSTSSSPGGTWPRVAASLARSSPPTTPWPPTTATGVARWPPSRGPRCAGVSCSRRCCSARWWPPTACRPAGRRGCRCAGGSRGAMPAVAGGVFGGAALIFGAAGEAYRWDGWRGDSTFLIVDATPPDAQVYLDGRRLGLAGELVARALPVSYGRHTVQCVAPGYRPWAAQFVADGSFPVRLRTALTRE